MIAKYGLIGFPLWLLWKWATAWRSLPRNQQGSVFLLWLVEGMIIVAVGHELGAPSWAQYTTATFLAIPLLIPSGLLAWYTSKSVYQFLFVLPERRRVEPEPEDAQPTQEFEDWDHRFKRHGGGCDDLNTRQEIRP